MLTPVIFGEVLFDIFESTHSVLGGAPFNVAWHLTGFGMNPVFISRVGNDAPGTEVLKKMSSWGMNKSGVQTDHEHPTGRVRVEMHDKEPEYTIESDQAYDFIAPPEPAVLQHVDQTILYHGSLALRNAQSRLALSDLKKRSPVLVFFDVNLRQPWWKKETILEELSDTDWLKCNEQELKEIIRLMGTPEKTREKLAFRVIEYFDLKGIVVTMGSKGALMVRNDGDVRYTNPNPVAELVDTVGAGDAFAAVTIMGLLKNWEGQQILDRASEFAAEICRIRGATIERLELYQSKNELWG
ncbi:MAG: carbohydrate kinase [Calditrichaceae bacterium]